MIQWTTVDGQNPFWKGILKSYSDFYSDLRSGQSAGLVYTGYGIKEFSNRNSSYRLFKSIKVNEAIFIMPMPVLEGCRLCQK